MKKQTALICSLLSFGLVCGAIATISNRVDTFNRTVLADTDHSFTLNETNSPLTDAYQVKASAKLGFVTLNYVAAKKADGAHCQLASNGVIYNFANDEATNYGKITGLKTIKVVFTGGNLSLETNLTPDGKEMGAKQALTSGSTVNLDGKSFFRLTAGDAAVTITSISLTYSCVEKTTMGLADLVGKTWTGTDSEGTVWKVVASSTGTKISSLNKETNVEYDAVPSLNGATLSLSINSGAAVYNGSVQEYGRSIKFSSASGAYASIVPNVDLYRVYDVEDFESYTTTGVGLDASHTIDKRTGLRAAFHSDFYSTGSTSLLGDKNWSFMGSNDYITLLSEKGHNDSKAGMFKLNSNGCRYISMNSLLGTPDRIGKGKYFSFWARGGYKAVGATEDSTAACPLKVRLFYTNPITGCNDANGTATTVNIPAGSDWTQYIIPMNENLDIYGYSFYAGSGANYLPVDDIQIFNANPYAKYEAPAAPNYRKTLTALGTVSLTSLAQTALETESINMYLALGSNGVTKGFLHGQNLNISNYDCDEAGNFDLTCNLTLSGVTVSRITGKIEGTSLTNVTLEGEGVSGVVSGNGSITLTAPTTVDSCDGTQATMQASYNRYYMSSAWTLDTSNADRITRDTENKIEGEASMSLRGYTKFSLTSASDFPAAVDYKGAGLWIRNNSGKTLTFKLFMHKGANLQNNVNPLSATIPSSEEWVYVQTGFEGSFAGSFYNFRLYFELASGTGSDRINIDYLHLYR